MSFRDNLLYLRAKHNMTQEQLACELGVSRQSVAKWESDKSYPEIEKLIKMSQLFDCTLDDLVQGNVSAPSVAEFEKDAISEEGAVAEEDTISEKVAVAEEDAISQDGAASIGANAMPEEAAMAAKDAMPGKAATFEKAAIFEEAAPATPEEAPQEPTCGPIEISLPKDEFGYDNQINKFAQGISSGVMLILFGVAVSIVFYTLGDPDSGIAILPENIAGAIGVLFQLAAIALGLAAILPACFEWGNFVRQHPYIKDFYTPGQKTEIRTSFARELIGGIIFVFIGTVIVILFADTPLECIIGVPLMMICIGIGAKTIIHGSMLAALSNINNYNASAAEVAREEAAQKEAARPQAFSAKAEGAEEESVADRRIGGLCGAIMIIATIAGLVMLFVPEYHNPLFWMAWPIGGLLCGLVACLGKVFKRE